MVRLFQVRQQSVRVRVRFDSALHRGNGVFDGFGDRVGAYQFQIWDVPEPVVVPIELESVIQGSITVPGEIDPYEFDATAGQVLFFDLLSGSRFDFQWTLTAPGGTSSLCCSRWS